MPTVVSTKPHAAAVLARLNTLTGIAVGDGERPATVPAAVFYDLAGGLFDGPVSDPDADVEWPFQVTCVGRSAEEARWVADKVANVLPGITVTGRTVTRLAREFGGVARDDSTGQTRLFYVTPRWRLSTTPT